VVESTCTVQDLKAENISATKERLKGEGFVFDRDDIERPAFLHPARGTCISVGNGRISQERLGSGD
jgi:hypothetical protein